MRHLHADVLIAIAKGLEVEVRAFEGSDWEPVIPDKTFNPLSNPDWMWRVKPEPEAEWKQKLRQAAREGKQLQVRCADGSFVNVNMELVDADTVDLSVVKESDYRIVPKTVTRWLFRYKHAGKWFQDKRYMTEAEANDAYEQFSGYRKIASTREECEE